MVGLILAAQLLATETTPFASVMIATDNQAAIQVTLLQKPTSGHALVDEFTNLMNRTYRKLGGFQCEIIWTPGHEGTEGNEAADALAKQAAVGTSSARHRLPKYL